MDYYHSSQTSMRELQGKHFNLVLVASGYEKRSTTLIESLEYTADRQIAFAFSEKKNVFHREENDNFFLSRNFELITVSGQDAEIIKNFLIDYFTVSSEEYIEILIDYSCMTKIWYATLINFFIESTYDVKYVSTFFAYTPAGFNLTKKGKPVKVADSLIHKEPVKFKTIKPLALIVGLGIEHKKAEYIVKKLKPAQLILMYADPAIEKGYVEAVLRNNRNLIESVEIRNLLNYPLEDMEVTTEILTSLCLILRMKYNIIIAPAGPKVFSLLSLLLAANYPDIDVWRVSSGSGEPAFNRIPAKDPLIFKVNFINENEDI